MDSAFLQTPFCVWVPRSRTSPKACNRMKRLMPVWGLVCQGRCPVGCFLPNADACPCRLLVVPPENVTSYSGLMTSPFGSIAYPLIIMSLTVVHFVGAIGLPPSHKERWTTSDILHTVPHKSTPKHHLCPYLRSRSRPQLCVTCLVDSCCDLLL